MDNESAEKKDYELSFLAKEGNGAQEILKLLAQHQAEIRAEGPLRKLNLAYPINHTPHAYFGFVNFAALPLDAKSLERDLESSAVILRALIIKLPKKKGETAVGLRRLVKPTVRRRPVGMEPGGPPKPLSNEAIEKKIEEILQ